MPVLPFCDPDSVSVAFGGISTAAMLCDIGLTASILAVVVHPKRRACCQEVQGIPVVRWLVAYVVALGGSLTSGRMNPLRSPRDAFSFGDVLVFFGFAIALSASIKMQRDRQHWALTSYFQTLGLVASCFFLGCLMVSQATHGWTVDCENHNDLIVPCLPETFYVAACAGVAACMMGTVVGVVFFIAADEVSFSNSSVDFLMLVATLVVVAVALAGFEYSSAKVYGGGVSEGAPTTAIRDVSSLGMVGTFFQCAGLIGGGSYATAGVMASTASTNEPQRNPLQNAGDGSEVPVGTGGIGEHGGQHRVGSARGSQHRSSNFGCSIVNCIGRVAVAASAWCAGGVVALSASQKGSACASVATRVGSQNATGIFIKVTTDDGRSVEVEVFQQATVENGQHVVLSRPWLKHAVLALSQVWAPAVIGLMLLGSAGQALTIATHRESPTDMGPLVGQPFETEIELAIADSWQRTDPLVEETPDEDS